jgi:hypothetical protein
VPSLLFVLYEQWFRSHRLCFDTPFGLTSTTSASMPMAARTAKYRSARDSRRWSEGCGLGLHELRMKRVSSRVLKNAAPVRRLKEQPILGDSQRPKPRASSFAALATDTQCRRGFCRLGHSSFRIVQANCDAGSTHHLIPVSLPRSCAIVRSSATTSAKFFIA